MPPTLPDVGSFLDRLEKAFGRGFLFAGVLPLTAVTAASLLAAHGLLVRARELTAWAATLDGWSGAALVGGALAALAVGGFILWNLNPALHRLLEGVAPWRVPLLTRWMEKDQRKRRDELLARVKQAQTASFDFRRLAPRREDASARPAVTWRARMQAARQHGKTVGGQGGVPPTITLSDAVRGDFTAITDELSRGEAVTHPRLDKLVTDVEALLAGGLPDGELSALQHALHTRWIADALDLAEAPLTAARNDLASSFPSSASEIRATTLGNLSAVRREYGLLCYGFDADALWLHLVQALPESSPLRGHIDEVKLRLDVCVAFTSAFAAFTMAGVVASVIAGHSVAVGLATLAGGTAATLFFYQAAVTSGRGLGDVVRAAVDAHRLRVLRAFCVTLPKDSREERDAWDQVARLTQAATVAKVTYDPLALAAL